MWIIPSYSIVERLEIMSNVYIEKIVAASLLGDGSVHIPKDGSKNAVYSQNKTQPHEDYVFWLKERLETVTKTYLTYYQPKLLNAKPAIAIRTRTHPMYTQFRNRMYGTGVKCVDKHYLTLLDWEFLAVWFQEDGTMSCRKRETDKRSDIQVSIATHCFSYGDHMLLKLALKEKLGLDWNIRQQYNKFGLIQYTLHLYRKHAEYFCDNIRPFVVPSFQYKCSYDMPRLRTS